MLCLVASLVSVDNIVTGKPCDILLLPLPLLPVVIAGVAAD